MDSAEKSSRTGGSSNTKTKEGFGVDRYSAYLGLLAQEQEQLDRLLELARQKRLAILNGAGDQIVSLANAEEAILEILKDFRNRRRSGLFDFYRRHRSFRGALKLLLLQEAPAGVRQRMSESLALYESGLMRLRRETKVNNTLLSDRLRLLHHTIEAVVSSVRPKEEYGRTAGKNKKRQAGQVESSMLVDQKV